MRARLDRMTDFIFDKAVCLKPWRTMRAVLCKEWGGPEKLVVEEVPSPQIRPGTVKIAVHAAGINFLDTLIIAGQYQVKPPLPFTPGAEAAGIVTEVGAGVDGVKVGDRVMAMTENGGYAEEAVVSGSYFSNSGQNGFC